MKKLLCLCLVSLLLSSLAVAQARDSDQALLLDGRHPFAVGDDPSWAAPGYDDSDWQMIDIPASWQSQGLRPASGIGWYRIHFPVAADPCFVMPAILLGRIGDADEVFLNGVKIGAEGLISGRFIEATKVHRLYAIPDGLLRPGRDNVLAVRVLNTYLNGGIFDPGLRIDEYSKVEAIKLGRERSALVMESCFLTFFAMFFMTCLFFTIKGLRDREYLVFWLFILIYAALFILGSVTFYNTGCKTVVVQQTINALAAFLPATLLLLLLHMYQKEITLPIKAILTVFALMALANFALSGHSSRTILAQIWSVCFVLTAAFLVFLAVRAYINKYCESGPVLVGIIGLVAGWILESIGGLDLLQITGFFLWDYSVGFFMVCVMYALTARYARIKKELREASIAIFRAHEDERKRLARELHDGIGPSLLAIKLELQILESTAGDENKETCHQIVQAIADVIEEIRSISMNLRPAFLENAGIVEAIIWHAENLQKKSGIRINIKAEEGLQLSSKIKDNLFRIYQESLNNAVKHSGATEVEVVLDRKGRFLTMEIKDDGQGFDLAQAETRKQGLGLHTIRERAGLLQGVCRIRSAGNHGTSIRIKVPT